MSTTTTRRRVAALLLALALPAGLAACGTTDRAQTGSQVGTPAGSTSEPAGSGSDPSAEEPVETSDASDGTGEQDDTVLASVEGEHAKKPNEEEIRVALRLDVTAVERIDGDAVEVRFRMTNLSDQTWEPWQSLGGRGGRYGAHDATLLDLPGDRRYLTLLDSGDNCLCSSWAGPDLQVPGGETHDFYARFPAPPEDVTTIELQVPGFAPVPGLEISS